MARFCGAPGVTQAAIATQKTRGAGREPPSYPLTVRGWGWRLMAIVGVVGAACTSSSRATHSHPVAAVAAPGIGPVAAVPAPAPADPGREPPDATVPLTTPPTTTTPLVPWNGPVEHLFFHTLIIRPDLAFAPHDRLAQGLRDYFVTVAEFRRILDQLYANGWTLVDIHRVVAGTVRVPAGRRPLVLSEDDVNYYDYSRGRGVGWRLVVDASGAVMVERRDGGQPKVTDDDLVPIVDAFVAAHPDFSADGAKGVIAVTGYEGLFGERVDETSAPDEADRVARAKAISDRLRATGWTIASHSFGHIDITRDSVAIVARDTQRWLALATPIVGPTDVYVYPFGAAPRPGSATARLLKDAGFTIQCSIDPVPRLIRADGITVMTRRHVDGIAFRDQARQLTPFFDVASVRDAAR